MSLAPAAMDDLDALSDATDVGGRSGWQDEVPGAGQPDDGAGQPPTDDLDVIADADDVVAPQRPKPCRATITAVMQRPRLPFSVKRSLPRVMRRERLREQETTALTLAWNRERLRTGGKVAIGGATPTNTATHGMPPVRSRRRLSALVARA